MSLKIMVVDDEPLNLKVMRSLAVPLGHKVLTFDDTQEADRQTETQRFDVVFVGMAGAQGLDVAHRVRNSPSNGESTIVMLSATDDAQTLRSAFGAGVTFVLPKPIVAARIIPMLNAMESPGWKTRSHAARLPLFTDVTCKWGGQDLPMRSMNISETGMLLKSVHALEVGQEVSLEFEIAEVRAFVRLSARIVRKEGADRIAAEFIKLEAEDQNAIQVYVMGHLKEKTRSRDLSDIRPRRLYDPLRDEGF
jgi:CheY-like chemotaxis protein